ncbi:regulator [Streptomyces sp. NBC_01216]|uniref:ATP-binding protein n=1 Tax=Streptomyces sp. NPDC048577 TaxID=3157209 RepID=UPI002E14E002|nr:regulator [Streptomyces sp. NBC_01216]
MRGHLPDENTDFVGRRAELDRLSAELTEHRLITVTGVAGVGKTRLALHVARQAAGGFPDGAWWADLTALDGDRLLVATVSDAVDLSDHTPGMPSGALAEWLAPQRLLLVLDSCDHVAEPCARLLADLLAAAPALTVLVTSRRPLGVDGERVFTLEPLPSGGRDAVSLLRRRATGQQRGGTARLPGQWRAGPATEICVRLEGIPLALELAAAQIRIQGVDAVRAQLDSRFDLLVHEERVWPQRHQTLRAAIGWSHELCEPLERLLWARLTVFRGPFDLASAGFVCQGGPLTPETLPAALDALVRCSVVRREGNRYRLLDTIREYGAGWLERLGETERVADRHAASCLELARRADAEWLGPRQLSWYKTLDERHTDLRTGLDRLLRTDPDDALALVGSAAFFWSCCGRLREARDYLEQALLLSETRGPDRARALWALGVTLTLQGDFGLAHDVSERCAREARHAEYDDRTGPGERTLDAAYLAGLIALLTGRPMAALVVVGHVLAAAPGAPADSAARMRCHLVRVFGLTGLGRLDEARAEALALRAVCLDLDEHWTRACLDYQLALTGLLGGEPASAVRHAREMLEGKRLLGDSFGVALGLDVLAAALAADGDGELAADVSGTSEAYWRSTGHPQRGMPEMRDLRLKYETTARATIGSPTYEEIFLRALSGLPQDGLDRALRGVPQH